MAKIQLDNLLKPLSEDSPCGPPLEEDITLGNLWREIETESRGKAEQQFGDTVIEAKPADWKQIHDKSLQVLEKSRHLGPAVYLTAAAAHMDGLPGFRDGLKLIWGFIDQFWETLHPLPDPDEPEDYYERAGLLEMMTLPMNLGGMAEDYLRFVECVRNSPLAQSRQTGQISYADILALRAGEAKAPTKELVSATFADCDPEFLEKVQAAASESAELVASLQERCNEKMAADAPNFQLLRKELDGIASAITEFTSGAVAPPAPDGGDAAVEAAAGTAAGPVPAGQVVAAAPAAPGTVQSRADVIRSLNTIISYYRANEPASPVPLLLQRAKKLVNNDFLGIIRNFRPDLERDFLAILGVSDYEEGSSAESIAPPPPPPVAPVSSSRPEPPEEEEEDPWKNVKF